MKPFDPERMRRIEHEAREIIRGLDATFGPKEVGITLFVFSFHGPEFTYISNADRKDMIKCVEEWLHRVKTEGHHGTSESRN